jgi:hypothetical protein
MLKIIYDQMHLIMILFLNQNLKQNLNQFAKITSSIMIISRKNVDF